MDGHGQPYVRACSRPWFALDSAMSLPLARSAASQFPGNQKVGSCSRETRLPVSSCPPLTSCSASCTQTPTFARTPVVFARLPHIHQRCVMSTSSSAMATQVTPQMAHQAPQHSNVVALVSPPPHACVRPRRLVYGTCESRCALRTDNHANQSQKQVPLPVPVTKTFGAVISAAWCR